MLNYVFAYADIHYVIGIANSFLLYKYITLEATDGGYLQ